ncbi:hypothetical protein C8K30_109157 [Promicromonospora sp. AC04]|uniref:DUF6232 family protein n=1 Tax=Promicromonospora sp. AC04 TaxID=2135723 RepID=UPI000D38774A|nr:DUF6232 family protein [Promicromonospora sp. AC04]PUB24408.1 hypothetical protein C8K30_109157 [Promicromonospora sp. AC04]
MWGRQRYEYAAREVRVANGMLTIGLTTFALSNIVRVEVVGVAKPQPIGPWANQVAYPFGILAVVALLLGLVGAEVPWEAAVALACAGLGWPAARAWQLTKFWKPVWRYPVFALQLVTATQHVHRICAHDPRHLGALAELLGAAMKNPALSYNGTIQVISNADALHKMETGKESMAR